AAVNHTGTAAFHRMRDGDISCFQEEGATSSMAARTLGGRYDSQRCTAGRSQMTVGCAQRLQQPLVELLFADTWLNHNDFKLGSQVLRGGQKRLEVVTCAFDDLRAIPPGPQASLQARQAGRRD